MNNKYTQSAKLNQSQVISLALQRALHVLQMPINELAQWLNNEIEQNPTLSVIPPKKHHSEIFATSTAKSPIDELKQEIAVYFSDPQEKDLALAILHYLNEDGFLTQSHQELATYLNTPTSQLEKICKLIASLDPCGIAALNLQDSLMLQLQNLSKEKTLLYTLIETHWQLFIDGQISKLAKIHNITLSELKTYLQKEVRLLNFHPGRSQSSDKNTAIPDIIIHEHNGSLSAHIAKDILPQFEISKCYQELLESNQLQAADRSYIRGQCAAGQWLKRMVDRRFSTLQAIADYLLEHQKGFFAHQSTLNALSIKDTAQELGLSISTINRAIKDKTLLAPQGMFELRYFFSNATVTEILKELIAQEDKASPLSDEALVKALRDKNIQCARRTIAKYRQKLKIPSASERRIN
ncbi:MAG: RNA polymerase factor sigma-54 [Chlamydiales bacterium]|nr:RNA polymerase factor sigma-54 [Chlamydiales bacterium]